MRERNFFIFQQFPKNYDFPRIASGPKKVTKISKIHVFLQFVERKKPIPNSRIIAFTEGVELWKFYAFLVKNRVSP